MHKFCSLDLKMGTILLVLSLSGNTPCIRLKLKTWANGPQISWARNLMNFRLKPSKSRLFLQLRDLIFLRTWPGPIKSKLSSGEFSRWWGMSESGGRSVGRTDSDILEPIVQKKLLNSFAICKGSVQGVLLIISSVIGLMSVLPNVTSFSKS